MRRRLVLAGLLVAALLGSLAWFVGCHGIDTRHGRFRLGWDRDGLVARCAPCRFEAPALGPQPVVLASLIFSVHGVGGRRLAGRIRAPGVVATWRGELARPGLRVQGELAPTPLAKLYALFGDAVPEARRARIEGELSATWRLDLPSGALSVEPDLRGFAVSGLGTEALRDVTLPAACQAGGDIPSRRLEAAVVAAEDSRFFEHPGYDLVGMTAAFARNRDAEGIRAGGSTLTQQLAKRLYTGDERSAARKLRELLYAVEMERTLGKGRILHLYLAMAAWGPGVCGASQAARHHLGKPAAQVDVLEAAWLASLLPGVGADADAVERERVAGIVKGMTGTTLQQRLRALDRLRTWTPPPPAGNPLARSRTMPIIRAASTHPS